jgi:hypothetical protein
MNAFKEEAIRLIQSLPDDCSLEEIQYHLYVIQKVERGLAAILDSTLSNRLSNSRRELLRRCDCPWTSRSFRIVASG